MDNESLGSTPPITTDTRNVNLGMGAGSSSALISGPDSEVVTVGSYTRRTSRVWRYFGMVDNCHYICRLCSFVGAYTNTTNMRKHIQHHHPERFQDILDHTRPTNRPFYASTLTSMPHPQQFPDQTHNYSSAMMHPQNVPGRRFILPRPSEMSYRHPCTYRPPYNSRETATAPHQMAPTSSQHGMTSYSFGTSQSSVTVSPAAISLSGPSTTSTSVSPCSSMMPPSAGAAVTLHPAVSHSQGNSISVAELSPEETKIMNQILTPLAEVSNGSNDSDSGGVIGSESQSNAEYGSNSGEEVPIAVSPEHILPEAAEHEPTPPPPTPPPQKPESYQLRHNNHLTIVLEALARDEAFMDVTLTAQGRSLKAHKSVLSAVSPYFRGVLRDNPCQHPIIIMPRDVRFEELYSIVNYIYKGEMTVAAEDLTSLLKTAEILQVSGLAPSDSSATVNPQTDTTTTGNIRSSSASSSSSSSNMPSTSRGGPSRVVRAAGQDYATPPTRPKSRDSSINPTDYMDVDMTCVKEEVASGGEEEDHELSGVGCSSQPHVNSTLKVDQQQQDLQTPPAFDTSQEQDHPNPLPSTSSYHDSDQASHIKADPDTELSRVDSATDDPAPHMCPHCEEQHRGVEAMTSHLRLKHPSKPSFPCGCGRVFIRQMYYQTHQRSCPSSS